jgi:hypothetical protein
MKWWLAAALILGIMSAWFLPDASRVIPAQADHLGVLHCYNDFNADEFVDISDVGQATGHFGEAVTPATTHLDIDSARLLEPGGNGYIDISDVSRVTQDFGAKCVVDISETSFGGPGDIAVGGCSNIAYTWYYGQASGNPWILQDLKAATRCTVDPNTGGWTGICSYTLYYLDGTQWVLYGGTPTGNFQFTQLGNFICGQPCPPACAPNDDDLAAYDQILPCGYQWIGKAHYWVYWGGQLVHHADVWTGNPYSPRVVYCT